MLHFRNNLFYLFGLKSPNSMKLCCLITESLSSSSIIKSWLSSSNEVLVKINHIIQNSMELCRLVTEFLWTSSFIISPRLPSTKEVLVKRNHTSPSCTELRLFITEFLWPSSSSITRPWWPSSTKVLIKTNHTISNSVLLLNYWVPITIFELHHQAPVTSTKVLNEIKYVCLSFDIQYG